MALGNLACNNAGNKAAIVRAGAIAPLVALLSRSDNSDGVKKAATWALRNLGVGHSCTQKCGSA